jgi:hypothetical protein
MGFLTVLAALLRVRKVAAMSAVQLMSAGRK